MRPESIRNNTRRTKANKPISLFLLVFCLAFVIGGCGGGAAPTAAPLEATPRPVPATPIAAPSKGAPTPPAEEAASPTVEVAAPLEISSSAFEPGGEIPVKYSCDGANLSPPLQWSGMPEGTKSLVLLVDDPDSEPPGFVHWVIYNLPATSTGLPEGVPADAALDDGTLQGTNDFARFVAEGEIFPGGAPINRIGYDGPCPPNPHHYVFTLHALDSPLSLPAEVTEVQVLQAMEGHILAQAEVIGIYSPQR